MASNREVSKKIEFFRYNAHVNSVPIDYRHFYNEIIKFPSSSRVLVKGSRVLALEYIQENELGYEIILSDGDRDSINYILDLESGVSRAQSTSSGSVPVIRTHIFLRSSDRIAVIEYNRKGPKYAQFMEVLEDLGNRIDGYRFLNFEIIPDVSGEFLEELSSFERIRVATVKLTRPNADWSDFSDHFTGLVDDSDGARADVVVSAGRGGSLKRGGGILGLIKSGIETGVHVLKSASVTGTRSNETKETTVSTARYQKHKRVAVRETEQGVLDESDLRRKILRHFKTVIKWTFFSIISRLVDHEIVPRWKRIFLADYFIVSIFFWVFGRSIFVELTR